MNLPFPIRDAEDAWPLLTDPLFHLIANDDYLLERCLRMTGRHPDGRELRDLIREEVEARLVQLEFDSGWHGVIGLVMEIALRRFVDYMALAALIERRRSA